MQTRINIETRVHLLLSWCICWSKFEPGFCLHNFDNFCLFICTPHNEHVSPCIYSLAGKRWRIFHFFRFPWYIVECIFGVHCTLIWPLTHVSVVHSYFRIRIQIRNCANHGHCFNRAHHNSIHKIKLIFSRTDMNMYMCAMCCGQSNPSVRCSSIIIKNRNYAKCETFQELTVLYVQNVGNHWCSNMHEIAIEIIIKSIWNIIR